MPPWGEEHGSTEAELWDCFVCEKGRCRAIFAYENNPPYLVNAASLVGFGADDGAGGLQATDLMQPGEALQQLGDVRYAGGQVVRRLSVHDRLLPGQHQDDQEEDGGHGR